MSAAVGRFAVPLKTMCSRKWPVPADERSSMREPAPTNTASEADAASGISDTSTRTPFGRTRFSYSKVPNASRCGRRSRLGDLDCGVADDELRARAARRDESLALEGRRVAEVLGGVEGR